MGKKEKGYCVVCSEDQHDIRYNISEGDCLMEGERGGCGSLWVSYRDMGGLPMSGLWTPDSW